MIEVPGEFLFIPKITGMLRHGSLSGVFYGNFLFTPEKVYMLPDQSISGAGMTVETKTLSMDGKSVNAYVQEHVDAGKSTAELLSFIEEWMKRVGMEPEVHVLNHRTLEAFTVKSGFFGGAVRWKSSKDSWADTFAMKSKYAARLREFLGLN